MNEHSDSPVAETAEKPPVAPAPDARDEMRRMSRRSFLWSGLAVAGAYGGFRWLATRRTEDGVPWPLRRALETNEDIARDLSNYSRLAPTFPASRIGDLRANGDYGLGEDFDPAQWKLQVDGLATEVGSAELTLAQIKALPPVDMITELKCIEGWSTVVRWTGVRLADFIHKYPPATNSGDPADPTGKPDDLPGYVGLMTPDGGYYVGLEMPAALHPQTLLCYAMNGRPLTLEHGAPLRLVTPLKYGIKNIKRIGTLTYTNQRPADYWAEQGYDYYAGF
jgi:DMSO/TMAO reductase YedYZ molybdopterin-dependent catalytic subunit